mgnify:CR=1 FL=1
MVTTIRKVEGLLPREWHWGNLYVPDDVLGAVLATKRIRRLFRRGRMTNCEFRTAEESSVGSGMN